MATKQYIDSTGLSHVIGKIKATYVQQVAGKGLSTNDLTNELLEKLNGVAAGAQVNVLEKVKVNGVEQVITDKAVDIKVPVKTSEITNDSGYITSADIPEGAAASTTVPLMDGEATVGTEMAFARGDHKHPTDTSRASVTALNEEITRAKAAEEANAAAAKAAQDAVDAVEADYLKAADKTELQGNINTVSGKVDTLIGSDTGKSARTIANEELAAQLIPESAKESLDTLGEIAAWIQSHPDDASAMNAAITALQNKVDTGDQTVSAYVADAIAALSIGDYAKAADLTALAARVKAIEDDYVKATELVALTNIEIDTIWENA